MEFTRRCSVCGKIYCYTDQDLKDSKTNAVAGAIGAIGTIASVFGGTPYQTFELDKMSDRAMNKMIDYEKCPNCGSSRTVLLTADELAKYKSSDHTTPVANPQMPQMVPINTNASTESLVERGMLFLEDQEWDKANAYFENVLDADPKNVQAYIGKLLVDLRLSKVELLDSCEIDFTDNPNYKKALRFSTEKEKEQLESINKERIYKKAKTVSREDYKKAIELLGSIKDYKDASQLIDSYSEIININIYEKALSVKESDSISQLTEAVGLLDGLGDYKDAKKIAAEYRSRIEELRAEEEKKRQEEENKRQEEAKRAAAIAEERAKQAAIEAELLQKKKKKSFIFAAVAAIVLIAVYAIAAKTIIPNNKYNTAVSLMENGEYDIAIEKFEALHGYKDSERLIDECEVRKTYHEAESKVNDGLFAEAYSVLKTIDTYTPSKELISEIESKKPLFLLEVGDTFKVGTYEQDNNSNNGKEPIEWVVLSKDSKENKLFVISKKILDCIPYNNKRENVTWGICSIREWLNTTFYDTAFSDSEKEVILQTTVFNYGNPAFNVKGGYDTEDYLYCPSLQEIEKYYDYNKEEYNEEIICSATPYAVAQGVGVDDKNNGPWILRTPGAETTAFCGVSRNGCIMGNNTTKEGASGVLVDASDMGVRPVMNVDGNYLLNN